MKICVTCKIQPVYKFYQLGLFLYYYTKYLSNQHLVQIIPKIRKKHSTPNTIQCTMPCLSLKRLLNKLPSNTKNSSTLHGFQHQYDDQFFGTISSQKTKMKLIKFYCSNKGRKKR